MKTLACVPVSACMTEPVAAVTARQRLNRHVAGVKDSLRNLESMVRAGWPRLSAELWLWRRSVHSALSLHLTVRMPISRISHSSSVILLLLTPVVLELGPVCEVAKNNMQQHIVTISPPLLLQKGRSHRQWVSGPMGDHSCDQSCLKMLRIYIWQWGLDRVWRPRRAKTAL